MEKVSVFKNNKSQAIRLPRSVAFPDGVKSVEIIALGRSRLVVPTGEGWDAWFDGEGVTDDFMSERDQGPMQKRDSL